MTPNYDKVDAAYIFKQMLASYKALREADDYTLAHAGELEDMAAMWHMTIDTAEVLNRIIVPTEFDRLGVFAYEVLDDKPGEGLVRDLLLNWASEASIVETRVRLWCAHHSIAVISE